MASPYFSPIYQNFVDPVIFRLWISIICRIIFYLSKTNSCSSCKNLFIYPFNSLIIAHGDIISMSYLISYPFSCWNPYLIQFISNFSNSLAHTFISMRRLVLYLYSAFVLLYSSFHHNLCISMCVTYYWWRARLWFRRLVPIQLYSWDWKPFVDVARNGCCSRPPFSPGSYYQPWQKGGSQWLHPTIIAPGL
jgi:hypothetical protein